MKKTIFLFACGLTLLLLGCESAQPAATSTVGSVVPTLSDQAISGVVLDETGVPIAGAVVRIKATGSYAMTDEEGRFVLHETDSGKEAVLTAWAEGYYIGGGEDAYPVGTTDAKLTLKKHAQHDNPDYQWVSAFASQGEEGNCENCHFDSENPSSPLPFNEWQADAHSSTVQNVHFITMYLGQDVYGNQSPPREYGTNRDYGSIPLRPDLSQAYYGPGYKLDFPETSGNCAACHAPAAAINAPYETDPTKIAGVGTEGVTCDFCHKVWDARLDPSTGLPQPDMPGVLSFEFRRPEEGHQFFAGPFDDVAPGEDTYTPIQQQSEFCAPCHSGSFWNTQIYDSFGEWLDSPYGDPETGQTCQDCHMPAGMNDHFARLDQGAFIRDPQTIFSHLMPGASDVELLQNAVTMTVNARRHGDRLIVDVKITNDKTGHDVPTDSPLRQMLLVVDVEGEDGQPLPLLSGETIPDWGGVGDPELGYYAGLPGKGYAKVLSELWTEIEPTGSYWFPTRIVSDNRIGAFETDTSTYVFDVSQDVEANVEVTLLFRRAFKELMDQKGWDVPDIVMEQEGHVLQSH
jgi:nitrate/TMAO reductase-like tetraheme cytochrome c subunit